jgi:hypothetical protein
MQVLILFAAGRISLPEFLHDLLILFFRDRDSTNIFEGVAAAAHNGQLVRIELTDRSTIAGMNCIRHLYLLLVQLKWSPVWQGIKID